MSQDPFLTLVAEALASAGRGVEVDASQLAIDISSVDPAIGSVLGIVRPVARAVTFYVVHPTLIPATSYADVIELVVRATNDLLDASIEVDPASGSIAYRMPVLLGELELDADELGVLLIAAVEAAESTAAHYRDLIDAVSNGEMEPLAAASAARRAPVEQLQADLDELEGR